MSIRTTHPTHHLATHHPPNPPPVPPPSHPPPNPPPSHPTPPPLPSTSTAPPPHHPFASVPLPPTIMHARTHVTPWSPGAQRQGSTKVRAALPIASAALHSTCICSLRPRETPTECILQNALAVACKRGQRVLSLLAPSRTVMQPRMFRSRTLSEGKRCPLLCMTLQAPAAPCPQGRCGNLVDHVYAAPRRARRGVCIQRTPRQVETPHVALLVFCRRLMIVDYHPRLARQSPWCEIIHHGSV